ncbi:DUF3040 domain-containing protein [Corynebacterium sp. TAE3-ERU12]|uniref:DUF3040 domain-containing protein n=1 Tax=Corynebacterium sp. TAE3-ERU12 TaxID=2849491 RepID=UPI001C4880BE|nr:DUF3040 domain-containing protein [Corynebacterium sp. TAE3-ERU12]MBV7296231.1 DUF3040 domain-containing protein [Corynebacterium sp. TAE3-ERU12]
MALSEQEQRMLDEIESALHAEDPKFSSTMSSSIFDERSGVATRGLNIQSLAIGVLGLALLLGGVALAQVNLWFLALSVVGFLAMFGAGVWAMTGSGDVKASAKKTQKVKSAPRRGNGGNSGPGSMESRFRGRFG